MSIAQSIQGKWCFLAEEEPYATEGRSLLVFAGGVLIYPDGEVSLYKVDGETITVPLASNLILIINSGDRESRTPPANLPAHVERIYAIVRTSFVDGTDFLDERATLVRQDD